MISEIKKDIYAIVLNHWDRRLFDQLIPLPDGTTYNSYFLKDEKNVLIDASDPSKTNDLFEAFEILGIKKIDYVISNHSEQDHSGSIPQVLEKYPDAKVITSEKGKGLLHSLLLIPDEKFIVVKDGEEISIGEKSLKFISAPWVHWPETILTYEVKNKILFPCDLFGSHLATSRIYASENDTYEPAKRYYAEIMMPFRNHIKKHLEKIKNFETEIIAPSHGPVYDNPDFILSAYSDWVSDKVKNEVVVPYVSMHGSVSKMIDYFIDTLIKRKITVKPFNLAVADIGEIAISFVDSATVVVGSPAVLGGPHPLAIYATYLFKILRPKTKFVSVIGSYGWGSNMLKILSDLIPSGVELIEPVVIKGYPEKEDFEKIEKLASEIEKKHKKAGL